MKIRLNGQEREFADAIAISQLLSELGVNPKLCVVEKNREIVKKENYSTEKLADGDEIEIVTLVGGG